MAADASWQNVIGHFTQTTMRHHFILLLLGLFYSCGPISVDDIQHDSATTELKSIFPTPAKNKNPQVFEDDTLLATVSNVNFQITPTGKLSWSDNLADTIQLRTDVLISVAYLHKTADTLFIFYTETDHEGATSRLEKINLITRQSIWQTEIQGFNLGLPYIIDNFAYVTTIGFAGKIDLQKGKYIYECAGLYDDKRYSFNDFDTIIFRDTLTFFLADNRNNKWTDTLIVNETSGSWTVRK